METIHPDNGMEKYLCDRAFETETPISGSFELLPICNMNCEMCYIRMSPEEMRQQGTPLDAKKWLEIGAQAAKEGTMFLLLTGGEPLLHPEFAQIYEGLRDLGIIVTINTNGTLIDENIVALFQKNMPRRVNISLYGASNETYARLCRNDQGFTQVMKGIHLLLEAGIPVKLNYTLTPLNYSDMEAVIRISEELQVPISIPTYMFPPARKQTDIQKGEIHEVEKFARLTALEMAAAQVRVLHRDFGDDEDYTYNLQQILNKIEERATCEEMVDVPGGFLCSAGVSSFWVNWKGSMTACGMMNQPAQDLTQTDFSLAWEYIKESSKQIFTSNKCFNCKYREVCHVCAASALAETGDCSSEVPYLCDMCEAYEKQLKEHIVQIKEKKQI